MLKRGIVLGAAGVLGLLPWHDAAACSCMGPQLAIVGPDRAVDVPVNTRVRLDVPQGYGATAGPMPNAVVRVPGSSTKADTTTRSWKDGAYTFVELTPVKPLAPETRYEVAVIDPDPNAYPSTTVLTTFKTGSAADTTPPKLDSVGSVAAKGNVQAGGGDCSIHGPWIEIGPVVASDPGRPNAKLMFGIWAADASGNMDLTKPPGGLVAPAGQTLIVGKRSLCDPHDFPISPTASTMTIAIAAVDEAGNMSTPRRLPKIRLSGVGGHP